MQDFVHQQVMVVVAAVAVAVVAVACVAADWNSSCSFTEVSWPCVFLGRARSLLT